nr:hypothetical protein [Acuticoccus mangrovi]
MLELRVACDGRDFVLGASQLGEAGRRCLAQPVSTAMLQAGRIAPATEAHPERLVRERRAELGHDESTGPGPGRSDAPRQWRQHGHFPVDGLPVPPLVLHLHEPAIANVLRPQANRIGAPRRRVEHQVEGQARHRPNRMAGFVLAHLFQRPGMEAIRDDRDQRHLGGRIAGDKVLFERPAEETPQDLHQVIRAVRPRRAPIAQAPHDPWRHRGKW